MSTRGEFLLKALADAVQSEVDAAVADAVADGTLKVDGMSVDQICALRKKFMRDTGLRPETLTVESILHDGLLD